MEKSFPKPMDDIPQDIKVKALALAYELVEKAEKGQGVPFSPHGILRSGFPSLRQIHIEEIYKTAQMLERTAYEIAGKVRDGYMKEKDALLELKKQYPDFDDETLKKSLGYGHYQVLF